MFINGANEIYWDLVLEQKIVIRLLEASYCTLRDGVYSRLDIFSGNFGPILRGKIGNLKDDLECFIIICPTFATDC